MGRMEQNVKDNDEEGQERRSKKKEKMDEILETSLIIANGSNCAKGSNGKKVENVNLTLIGLPGAISF